MGAMVDRPIIHAEYTQCLPFLISLIKEDVENAKVRISVIFRFYIYLIILIYAYYISFLKLKIEFSFIQQDNFVLLFFFHSMIF